MFCKYKIYIGLAHLHEHMMFLSNLAYPEEGVYERFLSQNGGSSNAYTGLDGMCTGCFIILLSMPHC
jgi:secreted Zn-dependent insulinase-like peptidase